MSLLQDVVAFFLWIGGTYAVGIATGLYTYYKTGARTYPSGRAVKLRLDDESDDEPKPWYMTLAKTRFTPGTVAVMLAWGIGYVFFGYALWRLWIAPAARESTFGVIAVTFALLHWVSVPLTAWLTFGWESLVLGGAGQLLNLASATVILGMLWKLHVGGTAALIGAGVSMAIYTLLHLLANIVHFSLLARNTRCSEDDL